MPVTVLSSTVTHANPGVGESTSTKSITVPATCNKIVVFASNKFFTPPRTVSSITFNGSQSFSSPSMSQQDAAAAVRTECWYLDNPTITTANLVVTWSGSARGGLVIVFLAGAKAGAPTTSGGSSSTSASTVSIASTSGGIVLSSWCCEGGDTTTVALTAGTSEANFIGSAGAGGNSVRLAAASQAGTGSNVSTTWTPSPTGNGAAHLAVAIDTAGPTITSQPTAQTARLNGDATTTATFSVSATGTGGLTYDWELETSVGGGSYANLADGNGATWTGQAASSCVGTFTAKTLSGRRVRCNVTDDNGTTTTDAVTLTVLDGPVLSASSATTNGSGVASVTMTSDDALTTNGEILLVTATVRGQVVARTTVRPA